MINDDAIVSAMITTGMWLCGSAVDQQHSYYIVVVRGRPVHHRRSYNAACQYLAVIITHSRAA